MIALPGYYEDPYYGKTQGDLYGMGSNLLAGKIPEYFRPIGEAGGQELEDVISMTTRDTQKALTEYAARVGNRGGINRLAPAIADVTSRLRYSDLMRAMEGRMGFLNTGSELLGGVRSAAIAEGSNRNEWALNDTKIKLMEQERQDKKKAARNAMYSKIISAGIGAASMIAGGYMGGGAATALPSAGGSKGVASVRPDMFAPDFFNNFGGY